VAAALVLARDEHVIANAQLNEHRVGQAIHFDVHLRLCLPMHQVVFHVSALTEPAGAGASANKFLASMPCTPLHAAQIAWQPAE